MQSNLQLFLGQFHPVLVHLPIGFMVLAGVFYFMGRKSKYAFLNKALPTILFLSAGSAMLAAFLGWMLAKEGGFSPAAIFWHKWLGVSLALLTTLAWLWSIKSLGGNHKRLGWILVIALPILLVTGHLGGEITHGKGYLLNAAPKFVQSIFGGEDKNVAKFSFPDNPDSIMMYEHFIQPMLDRTCIKCHNTSKSNGGLVLTDQKSILDGGDGGPILVFHKAEESELFNRVSLSASSKKFMPSSGTPLTYHEVQLLEFWINDGGSFTKSITDEKLPKYIEELLLSKYNVSTRKKLIYETKSLAEAPLSNIQELESLGFSVDQLSAENHFLDISYTETLSKEKLQALKKVADHITWINFGNTNLVDSLMPVFSNFKNLTRLRLDRNPITDEGLSALKNLNHLKSLNLYGTEIGDKGLLKLKNLQSLSNLYVWQTNVTEEGAEKLINEIPDLNIELGIKNQN